MYCVKHHNPDAKPYDDGKKEKCSHVATFSMIWALDFFSVVVYFVCTTMAPHTAREMDLAVTIIAFNMAERKRR